MAATLVGPCNIGPGLPGGVNAAYNVTAAAAIKAAAGFLAKIAVSAVGSGGSLTLNDCSGLVTSQTITGITAASAAVVTISTGASNPFAVGNSITFASVSGMTQINGVLGLVTAIGGSSGAWTVTTNINSSSFTAYSSGGSATSYGSSNQIVSIAEASLTAGEVISLDWPCSYGITVSAVPTGSPQFSISFT